jgi:Arylsulfotransferase (ASST)
VAVLDRPQADNRPRAAPPGSRRRPGRWLLVGAVVVAALVCGLVVTLGSGGSATRRLLPSPRGLDVLPFPGTDDASPKSQISFPELVPSQLRRVLVRGSRSGVHGGVLSALPDRRGSAFVPARPFTAGERVSVSAALSSPAAGTASGAANATDISFTFTVATPPAGTGAPAAGTSAPSGNTAKPPASQSFHSSSVRPPVVTVSTPDADASSGDVFVDAAGGAQNGPMILDSEGRLVWFDPVPADISAQDVNEQSYLGQPVLTWWRGHVASGYGLGDDLILDRSYQTIATVHAAEGYEADHHEFEITPQDTALITVYKPTQADLSSVGGPRNGTVLDSIVQEIDIKTGRLLWEWHALGHVPLSASQTAKPAGRAEYDYFHINSIQQLDNGNLLVSARNTWAVYEISRSTGKVIWTLGGKDSSFNMGPGTRFEWQHDARMQPNGSLTLFDDAASPKEESQSRAIQLTLNTDTMSASLDHSYTHTPSLLAGSQGDYQALPNGDVFVGWGAEPDFSEYTPSGQQIFSARFSAPVTSYRAFRHPWTAQPVTRPSISVGTTPAAGLPVYASWNGATNVARWQLMAGPTPSELTPLGTPTPRTGFETEMSTTTSQRCLAVRALDSTGRVLATSAAVARQATFNACTATGQRTSAG